MPSRSASLSKSEMDQILKDTNKTKQTTSWSISTFKGKLKFFRFKLLEYICAVVLGNRKTHAKIINTGGQDPPGPYPLTDLDPQGPYLLADFYPPPRIWTP